MRILVAKKHCMEQTMRQDKSSMMTSDDRAVASSSTLSCTEVELRSRGSVPGVGSTSAPPREKRIWREMAERRREARQRSPRLWRNLTTVLSFSHSVTRDSLARLWRDKFRDLLEKLEG